MQARPAYMSDGGSSPIPPPDDETTSGTSSIQDHSPCTPLGSRTEISSDDFIPSVSSSPRPLCNCDAYFTVLPSGGKLICPSCQAIKLAAVVHPGPREIDSISAQPESFLSYSDGRCFPPLPHSTPSTTSLPNMMSNDLCSMNYSPRFPSGHNLNPVFAQSYLLGDELGSGGYGFVMTALCLRLISEVAVKFVIKAKVPEQAWTYHSTLGRIPMEVMLLQIMNHENIVKCLDVFEDELFFYVVQELHGSPWSKRDMLCSGPHSFPGLTIPRLSSSPPLLSPAASEFSVAESELDTPPQLCTQLPPVNTCLSDSLPDEDDLHHVVNPKKQPNVTSDIPKIRYSRRPSHDLFEYIEQTKHKRLSEKRARHILIQVVEAIFYLNGLGICHRDIKDENLVIDRNFKVKLIDFGSATMVDPTEPWPFYNLFFGTTAYAASEVLLKQPYQAPPVEIWTLGVLMSYLLTGMSPFPTERDAIEGRIVLSELPGKKLSNSCLHFMTRCLEPDPSIRANIEEVRNHPWLKGASNGLRSYHFCSDTSLSAISSDNLTHNLV